MDRRLPVYLVVDCSESMLGSAFDGLKDGMSRLADALRGDPMALETVWISVIAFSNRAEQLTPLTEMYRYLPPRLQIHPGTALGAALDLTGECIERDVRASTPTQKGDWKPLVYVLTDGSPTDSWRAGAARLKRTRANVTAIACGDYVDESVLLEVADNVFRVQDGAEGWMEALKFVSASVVVSSVRITDATTNDAQLAHGATGVEPLSATTAQTSSTIKRADLFLAFRCSKTAGHYLTRYRQDPDGEGFRASATHIVDEEYFAGTGSDATSSHVDVSRMTGVLSCPHCGNPGAVVCDCGVITCAGGGGSQFTCPVCGRDGVVSGNATGTVRGRHG